MFKEEIKLYESRCEKFIKRITLDCFADDVPLYAECAVTDDPVPFSGKDSLQFHPVQEGEIWGSTWQSGWFRLEGSVPESWPAEDCFLFLNLGGEALIFDPAGEPFYALTEGSIFNPSYRKSTFQLPPEWVKDGKVSIWVEAVSSTMFGATLDDDPPRNCKDLQDKHDAQIQRIRLCLCPAELRALKYDFSILFDLYKALPENHYRRKRLMFALNNAIAAYCDNPINAEKARATLQGELQNPAGASALAVTSVGHAHIDVGWLWPVRESIRKAARTFSSQLQLIRQYPGYIFGASQPQLYKFVKDHYPNLYERIKEQVKAGRWELQGGMWVEADCNVISGESMVRQFLHGKNFFMDEFGVEVRNLWLPDVFGYSAALPQIIRRSNCDFFLTQKISWNTSNFFPHHSFRWIGLDGTEVLTHFPPENNYNVECLPSESMAGQDRYCEAAEAPMFLSLFGMGDGGGGPSDVHLERMKRIQDLEGCPRRHFGTAQQFFDTLNAYKDTLPIWKGELYLEMHRGTLTTQARTKKYNRMLEQLLVETEFVAACGDLKNYPAEDLDRIWKVLLTNQFHDIIPGSSIRQVYEVTEAELQEGIQRCRELIAEGLEKITVPETNSVFMLNTLSSKWSGRVLLPEAWNEYEILNEQNQALPRQKCKEGVEILLELEAGSGITLHRGNKVAVEECRKSSVLVLENDLIRYEFQDNGELISAFDKESGRESFAPGKRGNVFSLYADRPNIYDAWDVETFYPQEKCASATVIRCSPVESGAVESWFDLDLAIGQSHLHQRISLRKNSRRLDFVTRANWQETHRMLRVAFAFESFTDEASFEIQYGRIKRPTHTNTSYDAAKFEVVGHRYADRSSADGGAAVLTDCKYGFCCQRDGLDLNLLRSPLYPDRIADRGEHEFTYSFLPHDGEIVASPVLQEAAALNRTPAMIFGRAAADDSVSPVIATGSILLDVVKKAEKEDCLVLRLWEPNGQRASGQLKFFRPVHLLRETNLIEWSNETVVPVHEQAADIQLRPFEIKTFKVYFDK